MCILSKNGAVSKCKTPSLIGVFKTSRGKRSYTQLVGDCCRVTDELRLPRTPWNYIIRILPNVSYPKTPKIPKTRGLSQLDAPSDPSVAPGFAASRPALGSQHPAQGRAVPVPQPGHPSSFTGHTGKAGGSALGTGPHHQQPPRTLGSLRPAQPFPNRAEKTPHSQIPLTQPPHKGEGTRLVHQQQDFHHRSHPAGHQDENLVF